MRIIYLCVFSHILKLRKEIFVLKTSSSSLSYYGMKKSSSYQLFFFHLAGWITLKKCQSYLFIAGTELQVSPNIILLVKLICQSLVPKVNKNVLNSWLRKYWRSYLFKILHLLWVLFLFLVLLNQDDNISEHNISDSEINYIFTTVWFSVERLRKNTTNGIFITYISHDV